MSLLVRYKPSIWIEGKTKVPMAVKLGHLFSPGHY